MPVRSMVTQHLQTGFFYFRTTAFLLLIVIRASAQQADIVTLEDSLEVASIRFDGNTSFSTGTLKNLINTKESPAGFWTFIFKYISEAIGSEPKYFDHDIFLEDIEAVKQYYFNTGFFEATVKGEYEIDSAARKARMNFLISEGRESFIDSVYYKNLHKLPETIRAIIGDNPKLQVGNRYRAQDVQDEIMRIVTLLENNGYPNVRSDSVVVERRFSNNNILITLPFFFGRRLYFGDISVNEDTASGSINVARKLINDRLEFSTGEIYSRAKREQGEANLNKLRIFSSVRINAFPPAERDTIRSEVPIEISLQPKRPFEIGVGPLINNQESRFNIGLATSFVWLNIFGAAQIFSAHFQYQGNPIFRSQFFWMQLQSYQGNFGIKFEQPYFIDNATSGSAAFNVVFAREKNRYNVDVIQFVLGTKRLLSNRVSGGLEFALEQSEFTQIDTLLPGNIYERFGSSSRINYFNDIISVAIDRDVTNDFFYPSSGNAQKIIIEETGRFTAGMLKSIKESFQKTQYHKIEMISRWFFDLSGRSSDILALKMRFGGIFRYGRSKEENLPVPFNRSYYAGGSNSVRGWISKQLAVDSSKIDFGSNALFEASLETRWNPFKGKPTRFLFDLEPLGLVFFTDAGNLWNEFSLIRVSEIAMAVGIGVRYNTPFGPIRVDYGMRFYDPTADENQWITQRKFVAETLTGGALHFGIAHAF